MACASSGAIFFLFLFLPLSEGRWDGAASDDEKDQLRNLRLS